MIDLRIWILTHPASDWDAAALRSDCISALADQDLAVQVRVFLGDQGKSTFLSPSRYLFSALVATWKVGFVRLARAWSPTTLWWLIRQTLALLVSTTRLASIKHRGRVKAESVRASRIAASHSSLWKQAALEPAKLHLFLEDDVVLANPKGLAQATLSLLGNQASYPLFICDVSHSFSLKELGIEGSIATPNPNAPALESLNFPFTNTLAANFVSPELVKLTARAFQEERVGGGLGVDLDLMRLWSENSSRIVGYYTSDAIFSQNSNFRRKFF